MFSASLSHRAASLGKDILLTSMMDLLVSLPEDSTNVERKAPEVSGCYRY